MAVSERHIAIVAAKSSIRPSTDLSGCRSPVMAAFETCDKCVIACVRNDRALSSRPSRHHQRLSVPEFCLSKIHVPHHAKQCSWIEKTSDFRKSLKLQYFGRTSIITCLEAVISGNIPKLEYGRLKTPKLWLLGRYSWLLRAANGLFSSISC